MQASTLRFDTCINIWQKQGETVHLTDLNPINLASIRVTKSENKPIGPTCLISAICLACIFGDSVEMSNNHFWFDPGTLLAFPHLCTWIFKIYWWIILFFMLPRQVACSLVSNIIRLWGYHNELCLNKSCERDIENVVLLLLSAQRLVSQSQMSPSDDQSCPSRHPGTAGILTITAVTIPSPKSL